MIQAAIKGGFLKGKAMTPDELKIARELLGLSQAEAAEHIGGVSQRSWSYFESGERTVKSDIAEKVEFLLKRRREILQAVREQMLHKGADMAGMAVVYYPSPDHCGGVIDWRFSQSLARTLVIDYGAKLVVFDPEKYATWLGDTGQTDSEAARSTWAAYEASNQ